MKKIVTLSLVVLSIVSQASAAETVRRTPKQVAAAGVKSAYSLPTFEGVGFALGTEMVFRNNIKMMSYSKSGHGPDLMKALEDYSRRACIPNLLIAGHGSGAVGNKRQAIFRSGAARDKGLGFYPDGKGTTAKGTLKKLIDSNKVAFCDDCRIYIHACSQAHEASLALAKVTGCKVVSADDKVSPIDTNDGRYDHVWFTSNGGKFHEYSPDGSKRVIGEEFIFDLSRR